MTFTEASPMSSFLSGALGALAVLLAAGLVRAAAFRRWRHRGPARAGWLLRRIGATPEQERAVRAELDALSEAFRALRADAHPLRGDLADLIVAPTLDALRVREAIDARLASASALRARVAEAIARVHGVLDPTQRERLAILLHEGPRRHGCGRMHGGAAA
ncbi:Spy/CpxP family protein refolding chaperone [Anaeromyxobacter sp. PSR-1]|uniref:Spy/CpxP family protein refolding chaperone n=1 Tax=Anaeromyxobacter sp. PSR-1 TaxID=1300915 RepID=UPI001ED9954D|nr:periplasmic heavy metal sensor [Anaeromyxobacter sp. PSR-1]